MYENFSNFYKIEDINKIKLKYNKELNRRFEKIYGFRELMCRFQGLSFGRGEYRLNKIDEISKWNEIICIAFPHLKGKIECFATDWLGRQFAVYREEEEKHKILNFEPGTGNILSIDTNFYDFNNNILINNYDECIEISYYNRWLEKNKRLTIPVEKCVGYKIPLFLGGKDKISNLELTDLEVYWYITAQLIFKIL